MKIYNDNLFKTIGILGCLLLIASVLALFGQRVREVPPHPSNFGPVLPAPVAQNGNHYTIQICGDLNGEPMCSPIIATEITGTDPALFSAPLPGPIAVPDLTRMPLWQAKAVIRNNHLRMITPFCNFSQNIEAGRVDLQSILPGTKVAEGTAVRVWVSAGRIY